MSVDLLDNVAVTVTGRFGSHHAESFPDASGGPDLAILRDVDRRNVDETIAGVRVDHHPDATWTQTLQYGLFSRSSRALSPGVAPSQQNPEGIPRNADDTSYRRHEITVSEQLAPWSPANLVFGVDVQHESGSDRGSLQFGPVQLPTSFSLTRTIWAGFLETRLRPLPGLVLSGAARYDRAYGAAGRFNPKVAVDYTERTTGALLHLSWGRGFKLPSFYGLGNPIVGDPGLKPETSSSVEGGIGRRFNQVATAVEVTGFKTTYRDLIDFNPGPIPRLVNLSEASAHGGELAVTWHYVSWISVKSYVSYTVSRNLVTGKDIRDIPRWLAGLDGLVQPVEPLTLSVRWFHVGSYTDNSVPTGDVQLASQQRLDCSATWQVLPASKLYVSIDNVLDRRFQEAVGFPSPGRMARGGFVVAL
jgi:outer membrane cobalamin receptor